MTTPITDAELKEMVESFYGKSWEVDETRTITSAEFARLVARIHVDAAEVGAARERLGPAGWRMVREAVAARAWLDAEDAYTDAVYKAIDNKIEDHDEHGRLVDEIHEAREAYRRARKP